MATPPASATTVCWACGGRLDAKGDCVACFLRTALDESVVETKQLPSLVFGDFEIEQRPDGFYWELGHGAMGTTYLAMDKVLRQGRSQGHRGAGGSDQSRRTSRTRTFFT